MKNTGNRVLILANSSGGLVAFRKELILKLIEMGYEVYAAAPSSDKVSDLEKIGCKNIEIPMNRRGTNPLEEGTLLLKFVRAIKTVKPMLVITYTIKPNIYGGIICRLSRTRYACNITGLGASFQKEGLLKLIVSCLYRIALKNADIVFFENAENRNIMIKNKIIPMSSTCVLHGAGVNLEKFQYLQYPRQDNQTRFLFIGRVMREKGIEELFKATKLLVEDGEKVILDVVGDLQADSKEIMEKYGKEEWLNYHGFQEDVRPFIEQSNCFILPSYHEGMANVNLEAAASGRPIITSNIHGCKEAVQEAVTGYTCDPKDVRSIYNAMKKIIQLPYDQRIKMGKAGRRRMERFFDKNMVVKVTIENLKL